MKKKTYLKKTIEKMLVLINALIIMLMCMLENFNLKGLVFIIILLIVLMINHLIIAKYTKFYQN